MLSFKNELKVSDAGIFTLQETHLSRKGKLQIENFDIFEAIRKKGERRDHDRGT